MTLSRRACLRAAALAMPALAGRSASAQDRGEALRQRILAEFGPALPPAEVARQGAVFARHEAQFLTFAERHWANEGANWEVANYYDRARIFYLYHARTGLPVWLERANAIALDYRRRFIEAKNYGPSAHWSQMSGLYLHALATGSPESRTAIVKVGELFSLPYYLKNLGDLAAEMDNRIQARTVLALLYAHRIEEESAAGTGRRGVFAGRLREALGRILSSQAQDGAFRFRQVQCGFSKPYMTGLLHDALIEYHASFEPDPRIPDLIARSLDYLWRTCWNEEKQAFVYLEGSCGADGPEPAPDLNLLMVSGFGFLYRNRGDAVLRQRGDAVMAGGVGGAWLAGGKVFNQNYYSAYRYPAFRVAQG